MQSIRHRQPTAIFAISSLVFLLKDTDTDITQNPPCYCYRSLINVARVIMSSLWPAEKLMRCIVRICKFSSRDFQGRWMPNKMVSNFWIKQVKCKSNKKHFAAPGGCILVEVLHLRQAVLKTQASRWGRRPSRLAWVLSTARLKCKTFFEYCEPAHIVLACMGCIIYLLYIILRRSESFEMK